ncbi:MAG TPA: hypothetical protein VK807_15405 [Gemmatimonadaceae bacterium]|nr:hypothetical protein [Gemmatimonadaceae bacterium]
MNNVWLPMLRDCTTANSLTRGENVGTGNPNAADVVNENGSEAQSTDALR